MLKQYFDDLVSGIQASIDKAPQKTSARKKYALEISKIGKRLYSGQEKVSWCGVTAPFDLLWSMGVTSCYVEFIGAMLAQTGMVDDFLENAQHDGYAGDTCAYHRSVIGAAAKGLMPVPDFLVATNSPCIGGVAVMEFLAKTFSKDLFVLNVPQEPTREGVGYLADQLRHLVKFVEDHTKQKLDRDRLRQTIENTNKARELMKQVYDLAKHVPSPANGKIMGNLGIVIALLLGQESGINVAKAFVDEFKQKIKTRQSGVENEKLRLMWIQNRIQFKNNLIDMLENEYHACIVSDELNAITWDPIDPENPYEGLAQRAISIPFNGQANRRIDHLKRLAREYRIDGAINPCHWGCRQGTGARGLISQGLKEIDVPVLNLEVDCIDSRNFAEGQLKTRLEAFIEMLQNRSSPWQNKA